MHINSTLYARISPQWLSDLRRLWPSVPWQVRVSLFLDRFHHYAQTAAQSAHSNFMGSRVYVCFGCNLPLALLAEWLGSFMCHCGNTGVARTSNMSQHTKLTLEKKILLLFLLLFTLTTFWLRIPCSYQQAIPAPHRKNNNMDKPSNWTVCWYISGKLKISSSSYYPCGIAE